MINKPFDTEILSSTYPATRRNFIKTVAIGSGLATVIDSGTAPFSSTVQAQDDSRQLGFALVGGMVALAAIYGLNRFGQSDADAVLAEKLAANDRELADLKAQIQTAVAAMSSLRPAWKWT